MVALGHQDGPAVASIGQRIAVVGVEVEVIDGVLLRLGPQTLACHVGAHGGQCIKAQTAQQYLENHNGDERPDDTQQPWRFESPIYLHVVPVMAADKARIDLDKHSVGHLP